MHCDGVFQKAERPVSPPPALSALYGQLTDLTTNKVLMAKASTIEAEIASTAKIMTALLVITSGQLDRSIRVKQAALDYIRGEPASSAGLQAGELLTVRQLLYAAMLPSGCDAAYVLADVVGNGLIEHDNSGIPLFVNAMNKEAKRLGLKHTYFGDAAGQHHAGLPGCYCSSTAADLSALATYALQFPLLRKVVGTLSYSVEATATNHAYTWQNTNRLLSTYQGAIGVKTGTSRRWAGYCLVFAVTRQEHTLLGVILGSAGDEQRYRDAMALLDWGFTTLTG